MSCSLLTSDLLLSAAAQCIPPMDGQGGCVGVVGGSSSQPGAVSLAVGAALRAGADRVLACCADAEAAAALRCCWPTQPTLVLDVSCHGNNEQRQWLSERFVNAGCQAVLVGPGLDASDRAAQLAAAAIEAAQALNLPLVIDGSALSAVSNNPNLIRGNRRVILTPNWSEFCRLCESAVSTSPPPSEAGASAKEAAVDSARRLVARLSAALGGVCVLLKGREDVVAAGEGPDSQAEVCALQGSARRCTGQGALVAGLALVFSHWCFSSADSRSPAASSASPLLRHPSLLAAYAAAALARRCAVQAFASRRRATVASDSLEQIGPAFCRLFPEEDSSDSERDFEADQDKILLDELARQTQTSKAGSRKRPPGELLPVGLDSDNSTDDSIDEDDEAIGQYRDILKRAKLQRFRQEVAEDMGVGDDNDAAADGSDEERAVERRWSTSRRYQYAAGDSSDDADEDQDDGDDAAASLMRQERERLRRRLLGVGLPSDLPSTSTASKSADTSSMPSGSISQPQRRQEQQQQLFRLATELPAYERPPPGVSLERHLLLDEANRWPDMRRAFEQKIRLETRLKPLIDRPDSELSDRQAVQKWRYILLCTYLNMRADPVKSATLHRHPIRRLLQQSGAELRRLGEPSLPPAEKAKKNQTTTTPVETTKSQPVDEEPTSQPPTSGHRPIYWEMQKNLPVRLHKRKPRGGKKSKPGDSNPRVKLRDKFRKAMIKRRTQVPEVRPELNRYSGELSGIRAGLVKSRKFK